MGIVDPLVHRSSRYGPHLNYNRGGKENRGNLYGVPSRINQIEYGTNNHQKDEGSNHDDVEIFQTATSSSISRNSPTAQTCSREKLFEGIYYTVDGSKCITEPYFL